MENRIILGTAQLGQKYGISNKKGQPTQQEVFAILDSAWSRGIRKIDTADSYGESQNLLGHYLRERPRPFEILSKFRLKDQSESIKSCLENTLRTLGVDSVHCYSFHSFKDFLDLQDFGQIDELKSSGRTGLFGVSIYDNEEFARAIESEIVDIIQIPLNLMDNMTLKEGLVQRAKSKKKELHARSVFFQGLFFMECEEIPPRLLPLKSAIQRLKAIAEEAKMSMNALAIRYVFSFQEIDSVLIGVDDREQLESNLDILKSSLDENIVQEIHKVKTEDRFLLNPQHWQ